MRALFISLLSGSLLLPSLPAEDFLGADAVLKRLVEASHTKAAPEKKKKPAEMLGDKIRAFSRDAATMAPDEAASQWLALYDAYAAIPTQQLYESRPGPYGEPLSFVTLMEALPPSSAWPALIEGLKKHKSADNPLLDQGLQLFAGVLGTDAAARDKALASIDEALQKKVGNGNNQFVYYRDMFNRLKEAVDAQFHGQMSRVAALEKSLALLEKQDHSQDPFGRGMGMIAIPNLAKLLGEEKAAPLIERALRLKAVLTFEEESTRRLAAKLASKNINELKNPVWDLVETEEDAPLYEALVTKFPESAENTFPRGEADLIYLRHLISKGGTDDAAALMLKIMGGQMQGRWFFGNYLAHAKKGRTLGRPELRFIQEMLARDPSLPLWEDYIQVSAQFGEAESALTFLQSNLQKPGLSAFATAEMQQHLYRALLAADRLDEGVSLLREQVRAGVKATPENAAQVVEQTQQHWAKFGLKPPSDLLRRVKEQASNGGGVSAEHQQIFLALQLATLGKLLGKPELIMEGFAAARSTCEKMPETDYGRISTASDVARQLAKDGRGVEAEKFLLDTLVLVAKPQANQQRRYSSAGEMPQLQSVLAWIYLQNDRAADVMKLLEQSPFWDQTDLAFVTTGGHDENNVLLVTGQALAKVGRQAEAKKIALRLLQELPGNDRVYELLISLGREGLENLMDETYRTDRFEERPLIWKAKLQFDAGKLDQAEKTVRAAIAIDPSDGEEGKGDRMRAYAVLGDILEKKGDADQAKIMRGAVAAIRLSENADDWWQAGMLTHAVKMYEEALNLFADAYCIQSRLALRYSELGDFAKAEEHYRRAYELMPESFGRVESHCFGCEGAFDGERAQGIAERVFTTLAKKMPDRPQVFYLLGYLREQQHRFDEAANEYRKAVALDPDYLNAWHKLSEVDKFVDASPDERERIALAILRLDPTGKRGSFELEDVRDLGKLWDSLLAAERAQPKEDTGPIFELSASRAALQASQQPGMNDMARSYRSRRQVDLRQHFARSGLFNQLANLVNMFERQPF